MIALFVSSAIAIFLFLFYGAFITKLCAIKSTAFETLLIGLVTVNVLSTLLSIFLPITFVVLLCILSIAVMFGFYIRHALIALFKSICTKYHILLLSLPFLLIGCSIALQEPTLYDSALYHIQAIKWIEEYPSIPGLANLHNRFGFNPIVFSLSALTALTQLFHQEIFSINIVLFGIFTLYFINKLYSSYIEKGFDSYFIFQLIFFYVFIVLSTNIASPSPDYIAATLLLFVFLQLIEIQFSDKKKTLDTFIPVLILGTYCILAKLSTLPIAIILVYILYSYYSNWKHVAQICIGLLCICLPWLIKNIILTGWILFPFSALDLFDVDWKVPIHVVNESHAEIVGWARCSNDSYNEVAHMSLLEWMPLWWSHLTIYTKLLILSSALLPIFIFVGQVIHIIPTKRFLTILLLTAFLGLCFWFFTAPDFRFGQIFILIATCTPLLYFNFRLSFLNNLNSRYKQYVFIFICLLVFVKFTRNIYGFDAPKIFHVFSSHLITPSKIDAHAVSFQYEFIGKQKIYTPIDDERCYDHPLPCRPKQARSSTLRGENLKSGFNYKKD